MPPSTPPPPAGSPTRRVPPVLRRLRPLTTFLRTEAGGAVLLLAATVAALAWANSPWGELYARILHVELQLGAGGLAVTEDVQHWINDGLMTIFFFVIGLEIKREVTLGELQDPRSTALPVVAALGGIALPALLYVAVNLGTPAIEGWAIPVATDIAFAVGVLTLFGRGLPQGMKVLLLTLAIADDVAAILIIAAGYSTGISGAWLGIAIGLVLVVVLMRLLGVARPWAYLPVAVALWYATLRSGVHATIAGVALGLLTPATPVRGRPVLEELQHRLHPVSSFFVLPVFALANAGVRFSADALRAAVTSRVAVGIVLGLVVGKTVGVAASAIGMARTRAGRLPLGVGPRHLLALAPVTGIGFTVSLFIADLAFSGDLLEEAKLGILAGSTLAGVLGVLLLRSARRRTEPRPRDGGPDPIRPTAGAGGEADGRPGP